MSEIIERLGLPPSRRTASSEQVERATDHARSLVKQLHADARRLQPMFDRLNLIVTEYPGMTARQIAEQRPERAAEINEALRAEAGFASISVDLADLAGWLGRSGFSLRSDEP